MPSAHATATNVQKTDIDTFSGVTCSVEYITDASANALADKKFVEAECDMSGNFTFHHPGITHYDVIQLVGTKPIKVCNVDTLEDNLRDGTGSHTTTTLHMEILRDMYDTGTVRPSIDAITASFTDASITTFRATLYGAINHTLKSYVNSRFIDASGNQFIPKIMAKIDGETIDYGNTNDYKGFKYSVEDGPDPDGTEHGHMFLINLLNTCNQSSSKEDKGVKFYISQTNHVTIPITDLIGSRRMVMGLKVTTTGGFHNTHTNYAVGVNFV